MTPPMQVEPALHKTTQRMLSPFNSSGSLLLWLSNWVARLINQTLCPHNFECVVNGVEIGPGSAVRIEVVVAPGEVLAVVDSEVHVVQRVVSRAVDKLLGPVAGNHVAVVDEDSPDLHSNEEKRVQVAVHWADEDERAGHVLVVVSNIVISESYLLVWQGLHISVERVESKRSPGCRNCIMLVLPRRIKDVEGTDQSICGVACGCTCKHWGGARGGGSSK
jgi:hypothetical protein